MGFWGYLFVEICRGGGAFLNLDILSVLLNSFLLKKIIQKDISISIMNHNYVDFITLGTVIY